MRNRAIRLPIADHVISINFVFSVLLCLLFILCWCPRKNYYYYYEIHKPEVVDFFTVAILMTMRVILATLLVDMFTYDYSNATFLSKHARTRNFVVHSIIT